MTIAGLVKKAGEYAERQGFHQTPINFGERLMLVVSELAEAISADRDGKWIGSDLNTPAPKDTNAFIEWYTALVRGHVEEELADAMIRIADIASIYGIDLEKHIELKQRYNDTRPYKHGRIYG